MKNIFQKAQITSRFKQVDMTEKLFTSLFNIERQSFTEYVITKSFSNTGIYPFDPEKIVCLVNENFGITKQTGEEMIDYITDGVTRYLKNIEKQVEPVENYRMVRISQISTYSLYSPENFLEYSSNKDQAKAQAKKQREKKKEDERTKKVKALEIRKKRKCVFESCSHKKYGGENWGICIKCNGNICPKHNRVKKDHIDSCLLPENIINEVQNQCNDQN